jgi:hypothetical protein
VLLFHLRLAGWVILGLAAIYPVYPKRFGWRAKLAAVDLLIGDIFVVHVGFILLLLVLQGVLLAFFPAALFEPGAAAVALGVGLVAFWAYRLFAQLVLFDRRNWVGDRPKTLVHVAFTLLWAYLTAVFVCALAVRLGA